jgi:hypothetical protein
MHSYSQAITDVTYIYTIDHKTKVDFRSSDQLLEAVEEIDFELDLELS